MKRNFHRLTAVATVIVLSASVFAEAQYSIDWSTVDGGVAGSVSGLAVSDTNVYVGGIFKKAGGVNATNIARWNGSSWCRLAAGWMISPMRLPSPAAMFLPAAGFSPPAASQQCEFRELEQRDQRDSG